MSTGLLDQLVTLLPSRGMKAVTGPGFRSSSYYPQLSSLSRDPLRIMRQAQDVYLSNRHVRKAERVISQRFSTVDWHLEDGSGVRIGTEDGENADPRYLAVLDLIERPYHPAPDDPIAATPRTRAQLWGLGCRHTGLCGMGYWYLDEVEALAGTPTRILYINPCRMKPATDDAGNLHGWVLDPDARNGGTPLETREVIPFYLEPPDTGHLAAGLVETAMTMVDLTRHGDRHAGGVLAGGGRLAGVFAPPTGETIPVEQYDQLVMDLRNAADNPDSAKRMNVLRGPVEFTRLSATPSELDLVAVMNLSRDEVAELWGVPRSQVGGSTSQGLNSGESKGYDEAVLWQNAVGPRLRSFAETVQFELLDRYAKLGITITLVIEEPEFDDETPMYERARIAAEAGLPLTNRQRLELIGADPFGDERDDEVWLPATFTRVYPVVPPAPTPPALLPFTGQESVEEVPLLEEPADPEPFPFKATFDTIRDKETAAMQRDVAAYLARYGDEVRRRVEARAGHLARKPGDTSVWWDAEAFEAGMLATLRPHVNAIALASDGAAASQVGKASTDLSAILPRLLRTVGIRIKGIGETTRDRVRGVVERGIAAGMGAAELGDLLQREGPFGELRAETIARTETMLTLNEAALESYREFGVEKVQLVDGDDDPECAARNGRIVTLDEALAIQDHPNGTLTFTPLIGAPA